jgi:hypothetical protein
MQKSLIGHTGFVGSTLRRQTPFAHCYRSSDIHELPEREHELLVCAGVSAKKWLANRDPEGDWRSIQTLINSLETTQCRKFVLISTIDVLHDPIGADEDTAIDLEMLQPYGRNRRQLELYVQERFKNALVIRLPGLVGPELRKNAIFDLLNNNNLDQVDSRGVFQFYPMVNLWSDIQTALAHDLRLLHLCAEPISVSDVAIQGFGRTFKNELAHRPGTYDMRSQYVDIFGANGYYQYSARESMLAIRAYAQSEPLSIK